MEEKPIGVEVEVGVQAPIEQVAVESPMPVIKQKPKINKFVIIGVILGVLVVAGVAFGAHKIGQRQIQLQPSPSPEAVVSPTPDPTADWETYVRESGKFSIKYPSVWPYIKGKIYQGDINAEVLDKIHFGTADPDADNKPNEVIVFLAVYKESSVFGTTPEEYFQKIEDLVDPVTKKEVEIDGLAGIRAIVKGKAPFSDAGVVGKDSYLFRIELLDSEATNENREGNEKIFNLMISTFKFLEEKEKTWQELVFPKKLSLKYPVDWIKETNLATGGPVLKLSDNNYLSINESPRGGIGGADTIEAYCELRTKTGSELERR